jgi:DNA-binding transcriptional MerR regulator
MQIGEVAQATGLSRDALRFYEKRGLLRARRNANGYRDYPPAAVEWLIFIRKAQALGFTLTEIEAGLPQLTSEQASEQALRDALQKKLIEIEQRISGLQALRGDLRRRLQLQNIDCPVTADELMRAGTGL